MAFNDAFLRLAIAFGLGLLVGLQRERAGSELAGLRTFGLIAALGAVAAFLAGSYGGWIVGAGALALAALLVVGNAAKIGVGKADPGQTTEVAALVIYGVGALAMSGEIALAAAVGGATAALLHFKEPMHAFVGRLGEDDVRVVMQFALLSLVILPVVPNRPMGPAGALNPFEIWLMVVLIVGIGLAGYIAQRLLGARAGAALGGILGGLVSSTATTLAAARAGAADAPARRGAAAIILLASATMMVRITIEAAVAGPALLRSAALPFAAMFLALAAGAVLFLRRRGEAGVPGSASSNPAALRVALVFGALYAAVSLAAALAKERFGSAGVYGVAAIAGLTDLDAITLSTARTVQDARLDPATGVRAVVLAVVANLGFKTSLLIAAGGRSLVRDVGPAFAAAAAAGGAAIFLL